MAEEDKQIKKKILIVTNHSYMLWQFRRELIAELMKKYEVVLSMPFVGHEEDFRDMGVRCVETAVDRRGINPITDLKLLAAYWKLIKKEKPDKVITYSIKPNVYAGILCSVLEIPYCANVQGLGTSFQKKGLVWFVTVLYKTALRKAEVVFFENEENAGEFRKRKIISSKKQVILKGAGVNLQHYTYQPYQEKEKVHFLFLGRIMKEKGMDELLYAARKLKGEGYQFVLDLVGFFEDEYEEEVKRLQEEGIAVFHGFQMETRPYYGIADCVVMPSYHEGMSNVNLEAAATGRVVITTDIPGCREAVDHEKTGFLCKARDKESLYKIMKRFLKMSLEERIEMGKGARKKMEWEFDKDIIVRETTGVIEGTRKNEGAIS